MIPPGYMYFAHGKYQWNIFVIYKVIPEFHSDTGIMIQTIGKIFREKHLKNSPVSFWSTTEKAEQKQKPNLENGNKP